MHSFLIFPPIRPLVEALYELDPEDPVMIEPFLDCLMEVTPSSIQVIEEWLRQARMEDQE